eukprot:1948226-Ditylum_brightwellii.AAC.1
MEFERRGLEILTSRWQDQGFSSAQRKCKMETIHIANTIQNNKIFLVSGTEGIVVSIKESTMDDEHTAEGQY